MIHRADIAIAVDIDESVLRDVDAETVLSGIACIHGYENGTYAAATWREATETLDLETEVLRRIDAECRSADEFDEAVFEAQAEAFLPFEFGICGVVEALCAAGCPTFASCGGHGDGDGFGGRSTHPWVLFAADRERLPLLVPTVKNTGCGLDMDERRLLILYAASIEETIAFGKALTQLKDRFDGMRPMVDRQAAAPLEDDDRW